MRLTVRLRPWQKAALDRFSELDQDDFLAVATPGAGKTTFALTAARTDLAANPGRRLIVVAPTQHLKIQWARAALKFGLALDHGWTTRSGGLASDVHGAIVTYQQVAADPKGIRGVAHESFVVLDEIHHAGDERAWGEGIRFAFAGASRRLALSGTPFRSDTNAIPFVTYHMDEARSDFTYGYGDALADGGVVRPVHFPRMNGEMEWVSADGQSHHHTFDDELDKARSGQRLRTALSLDGEWLPAVLRLADARLSEVRETHPEAGGLVICADQDHARGIAEMLRRRFARRVVVATSDDPEASKRIADFAESSVPWIVAVRMVSEGVDIPRLRVGVFATTTTTELFFRQAVGRLVRWTEGLPDQRAWFFLPDDSRLASHASLIGEERRHSTRRRADDDSSLDEDLVPPDPAALDEPGTHPQLSLFEALSAVAVGDVEEGAAAHVTPPIDSAEPDPAEALDQADDALVVDLAPLAGPRVSAGSDGLVTPEEHKKDLRQRNQEFVRDLANLTGWTHARINAELNQRAGIAKITQATAPQLERRLRVARSWRNRL